MGDKPSITCGQIGLWWSPGEEDALSSKGIALYNLGNHTGAIEYYDKALTIDPHDETTLHTLYNKRSSS
ncbi:MAG: tetratricopeptide repeat protein [Candidatus Nitrosopolaris sp.]